MAPRAGFVIEPTGIVITLIAGDSDRVTTVQQM